MSKFLYNANMPRKKTNAKEQYVSSPEFKEEAAKTSAGILAQLELRAKSQTPQVHPQTFPTFTLWGTLDRAFQSGEMLDDKHVSDIYNRLPPAAQTHFIDTIADYIRAAPAEQMLSKKQPSALDVPSLLTNEALLLSLVEKTKQTTQAKEDAIQQLTRRLADWQRYHQTAPATETLLEEVLYGPDAAKVYARKATDEDEKLIRKALEEGALTPRQDELINMSLQPYERNIRDRLRMMTAEYLRIRHVTVEKLLNAVPPDPKQLALVTQSAVRQELLAVPESEFLKRIRTAALIRAYSFGKELRHVAIRQFFRGIVEEQ